MELRDLHYFEIIAETGNLGIAAQKVHRSQPAMSLCIQRLEEELGTPLFERSGRKLHLTPMGERLQEKALLMRRTSDEAMRELTDFAQGITGDIRMGCASLLAECLLPQVIMGMFADLPNVKVDLTIGPAAQLAEQLQNGDMDLLITPLEKGLEGLTSLPLIDDEIVVAAHRDHPIFSKPYALANLAAYQWVLPRKDAYSRQWLEATLHEHGCPAPDVRVTINAGLHSRRIVACTHLLGFFSRRFFRQSGDIADLREVVLPDLVMKRIFSLVYRTNGYLPPAASRLVTLLMTKKDLFLQY